jgi:hypothetical protein
VLRPGGCFCACVPHPFSEAGEFEGSADDAPLFLLWRAVKLAGRG